jgi:hypothetical protein
MPEYQQGSSYRALLDKYRKQKKERREEKRREEKRESKDTAGIIRQCHRAGQTSPISFSITS